MLIDLELKPGAAGRDDLRLEDVLGGRLAVGVRDHAVLLAREVHARRTDELAHDDALRAVDDEGALIGHHGEIAHEDELLLDLARLLVGETNLGEERRLVGHVLGAALVLRVGSIAELVMTEGDLQHVVLALDGARLLERFAETLIHEALEGFLLHGDEVGKLHGGRNLAKVDASALRRCCLRN